MTAWSRTPPSEPINGKELERLNRTWYAAKCGCMVNGHGMIVPVCKGHRRTVESPGESGAGK